MDFVRLWDAYKAGFGNVAVDGSHWQGLDHIHHLTKYCGTTAARISLEDCEGNKYDENYAHFFVSLAE